MPPTAPVFDRARHIKYWKRNADLLPEAYTSGDAGRLSLGFFIVAALDLLGVLENLIPHDERTRWIDWIYSLQVPSGGFRGFSGTNLGSRRNFYNLQWDPANLHNTYLGLVTLLMLGDDLKRVRRKECLQWTRSLARANGSFGDMLGEDGTVLGKDDLRSSYCAAGIVYILADRGSGSDWLDKNGVMRYLANCQDIEGAFGQAWLREAHAGLNFCGLATLACLDRIHETEGTDQSVFRSPLLRLTDNTGWILQRQTTWLDDSDNESDNEEDGSNSNDEHIPSHEMPPAVGFSGRCNKMADTCYCFWNSGALSLLGQQSLINEQGMRQYLYGSTQHMIGGFSKVPGAVPDLLHAYLGLAALAVVGQDGLQPLDSVLCVSVGTKLRLEQMHKSRS